MSTRDAENTPSSANARAAASTSFSRVLDASGGIGGTVDAVLGRARGPEILVLAVDTGPTAPYPSPERLVQPPGGAFSSPMNWAPCLTVVSRGWICGAAADATVFKALAAASIT